MVGGFGRSEAAKTETDKEETESRVSLQSRRLTRRRASRDRSFREGGEPKRGSVGGTAMLSSTRPSFFRSLCSHFPVKPLGAAPAVVQIALLASPQTQ